MDDNFEQLFALLKQDPGTDGVFNPWYDVDFDHDTGPEAPEIRRNHLRLYLGQRRQSARYLFCGEAIGYQGGHFSGIAMTSERILSGHFIASGMRPEHVFHNYQPQRTSRPELKPMGFTEPTATIVWNAILEAKMDPFEFILWNIFPWHPFKPEKGFLSNRTPSPEELESGRPVMHCLLALFPRVKLFAIGEKSAATLATMTLAFNKLRHPAQGGAGDFRRQFKFYFT